ncbi:MAG: winged helix-turn-helix transcriptional regulator [Verrucomicrobia bacterium]|nr:winged helix-turn-helix transcriptional regulator [Verrucomicrobiota bacterium]
MTTAGLRNADTQTRYRAQAKILKALSHPTRLFMVDELSHGPRSVRELTDLVGSEMSTVSKHLSLLKHAGIVADEKRGSQVFYRLTTPCVLKFFHCVEAIQEANNGTWYQPA